MKKEERDFLFLKYKKNGLSIEKAILKINGVEEYLKNFREKLKKKKLTDEEINERFKREFEKICQRADGEFS
jgi:hypothetical protein